MDLIGKFAVITGGSVGFGYEAAQVFAKSGAEVFSLTRRLDVLARAARELAADDAKVYNRAAGQMSVASVDRLAEAVLSRVRRYQF